MTAEIFPSEEDGLPYYRVYLDARMDAAGARRSIDFLREGNFLSNSTQSVSVEFGTFNRHLRHFAWCKTTFTFTKGGLIESCNNVDSFALGDWEPDTVVFLPTLNPQRIKPHRGHPRDSA